MATYEVLKLGVGLNTSSAEQALSNLKRTITRAYSSETATKFDVQVQKTTAKLEEQRRKAETLRKQLNDIATSQVTPKSIEDLSEKVKKGEQQISSLAVKLSDLNTKKEELLSTGLEIGGKTIFTESTRAEINKVNIELRETEQQLKGISNTTETARASLQKLKANPALTVEFKKANEALLKTEDELQATKTQLKALQTQGKNTGNALTSSFDKTSQSVRKFGKKL